MSSPLKKGLHNIYESYKRLENKYPDIFYSIVAKLLWVEKGGRPNIDPAISSLCTRVTNSINGEKKKLRRVLKYLKHTIDDKIIMVSDILIHLCTWVDAAYGVHPDLKIHTGGFISFGYGMVHCKSSKQKLNTENFH